MLSRTRYLIIGVIAILLASCGEGDGGLYRSQCKLIDCSYDEIKCYRHESPLNAIEIYFIQTSDDLTPEETSIILCDIAGIDRLEGQRFEGQDLLNRCTIYLPPHDVQLADFEGNFCKFSKGGDDVAKRMSGKCYFAFDTGYSITAEFSCILEDVAHQT